jgi:predicted CXXCH cytochrome family protein
VNAVVDSHKTRLFALAFAWVTLLASPALGQDKNLRAEGFTEGKHKNCIGCHQSDPVKEMFRTRHADSKHPDTPASKEECEACHGPSEAHSNFPLQIRNFRFGDDSPNSKKEQNQACLRCHESIASEVKAGAMHKESELSCASCHTMHTQNDPLLDHSQTALICVNCHTEKQPQQQVKGLHLIENGRVTCLDCHNPHAKLNDATCTHCHEQDTKTLSTQSPKAQEFHRTTRDKNLSCLKCHSGVAHGVPDWVDAIHNQQQEDDQ